MVNVRFFHLERVRQGNMKTRVALPECPDPTRGTRPCSLGVQLHTPWLPHGAGCSDMLILKSAETAVLHHSPDSGGFPSPPKQIIIMYLIGLTLL